MTPTVAVATVVAVASARPGRSRKVGPWEEQLFRSWNQLPDQLHPVAWPVMQLGSLAGAVAVGVIDRRQTGRTTTLGTGVALWAGVKGVKRLVGGRGRPPDLLDDVTVRGQPQQGRGWPSGHSAVSLGVALVADVPPPLRRVLVAGAAVTGASRMYVGAHLPADIAGGWAIAVVAASRVSRGRRRRLVHRERCGRERHATHRRRMVVGT